MWFLLSTIIIYIPLTFFTFPIFLTRIGDGEKVWGDFPISEIGRTFEGKNVLVLGCDQELWVVILAHSPMMILVGQWLVISGIWGPDGSTFGKHADNATTIEFSRSRCADTDEFVAKK